MQEGCQQQQYLSSGSLVLYVMSPIMIDSYYPAGQVRLPANVRQYWVGRPHVHHGYRPRLLQRLARRKVQDERGREELQRLFLHVLPHDVPRVYHGNSDPVQVKHTYWPFDKVTLYSLLEFYHKVYIICQARDSPWQHSEWSGIPGEGELLLFRSTDPKYKIIHVLPTFLLIHVWLATY